MRRWLNRHVVCPLLGHVPVLRRSLGREVALVLRVFVVIVAFVAGAVWRDYVGPKW